MKKRWKAFMSIVCYTVGLVAAIYLGGWIMLIQPINEIWVAYQLKTLSWHMLLVAIVKIALSTTVAGAVWCAGYIGYNHFIGTEDEYDRLMAELKREREAKRAQKREMKRSTHSDSNNE